MRSLRSRPMNFQVSVILDAAAETIIGRCRPGEGEVEPIGKNRCRLRTQGDHLEWLAFMIIFFNVGFEVEEPPELIRYLTDLSGRLAKTVKPAS